MKNEEIILPLFMSLYEKLNNKDFVIDKSGVKVIEEIGYQLIGLNPKQNFLNFKERKTNIKYCEQELNWYLSQSLSIEGYVDNIKIWSTICSRDNKKEINSNYGWCIFSDENYNQYENCKQELIFNPLSRRALMLYTRPSMHIDYNKNGMSDFICTNSVQCFIRNNSLIYFVHQRSCDGIYGLFNDFYWHCYVYNRLYLELKEIYPILQIGTINFFFGSFHIYERHFDLFKRMVEYTYKINCKIYKITNLINNKCYIGQTQMPIMERFNRHCHAAFILNSQLDFSKALRKYGIHNFKVEGILDKLTAKEAEIKEKEFIKLYNSNNKNFGYNMTEGGKGTPGLIRGKVSKETKEKMRKRSYIHRKGIENPRYKIVPENIVQEMITLYVNEQYTLSELSIKYKLKPRLISRELKLRKIIIVKSRKPKNFKKQIVESNE